MRKLLLAAFWLPVLAWSAEYPFSGTWKLNVDKVQFPDKPDTWVISGGTFRCSTCVPPVDIKADGTDQATPGTKYRDTLAVKIVDNKTVEMTSKKGGKLVATQRCTVSGDGQSVAVDFAEYPENSKQPAKGRVVLTRVAEPPAGSHAYSGSWRAQKIETVSPNAITATFQESADGLKMTAGTGESYDARFDGKDYAVKGDRGGSTVSLTKVNERAIDETVKRDGKVVAVNHLTLSADGKTINVKSEDRERGTTSSFVMTKQ